MAVATAEDRVAEVLGDKNLSDKIGENNIAASLFAMNDSDGELNGMPGMPASETDKKDDGEIMTKNASNKGVGGSNENNDEKMNDKNSNKNEKGKGNETEKEESKSQSVLSKKDSSKTNGLVNDTRLARSKGMSTIDSSMSGKHDKYTKYGNSRNVSNNNVNDINEKILTLQEQIKNVEKSISDRKNSSIWKLPVDATEDFITLGNTRFKVSAVLSLKDKLKKQMKVDKTKLKKYKSELTNLMKINHIHVTKFKQMGKTTNKSLKDEYC